MKATLTFNLSDPDDKYDHEQALKANAMACSLHDIYNMARTVLKHGEKKNLPDVMVNIKIEAGRWLE